MSDIFLSYSRSEQALAEQIVALAEAAGMSVWHWTRDIVHATSHPEQTFAQIDGARCFLCIISKTTIEGDFIFPEILRAYSQHKRFVVVLTGLTYSELERERPRWCQAFGFVPAIDWKAEPQEHLLLHALREAIAAPVGDNGGKPANPAGDALISLTKDETWIQARARNMEETYGELTARLRGLPEDLQIARLKERLKNKLDSLRKGHESSRENPYLRKTTDPDSEPQDEKEVAKMMWNLISAAVWEKSQKDREGYIKLLDELLANIMLFERNGTSPSEIMNYVHRFFLEV